MKRGSRPELVWGIGLSEQVEGEILAALGPGYHLRNWSDETLPKERDIARCNPLVIWITRKAWGDMPDDVRRRLREWELPQRVLLVEDGKSVSDFEDVVESGFLSAVSLPLTTKKIRDVIFRAKEVKSLYDDIFRMTREIMLERELLARKTDLILFLNQILTRASESLDPTVILTQARDDLGLLLPIKALMAAFWQADDNGVIESEFFLEPDMEPDAEEVWTGYLLDNVHRLTQRPVAGYQVAYLGVGESRTNTPDYTLDSTGVLLLPLKTAGHVFGCLAISRGAGHPMGKDEVQALYAAVNHLSLALRNAALFSEVKTKADHDGLTRIHNRRAFDERLVEELKRHQRYSSHLSLLMLDLDHFKQINDQHGHQAGDSVLREIGRVLQDALRSTDFGARYGGEEFVVILPQTSEDQAWILAERLRRSIASVQFAFAGREFQVTTSIGVATLKPGALNKRMDLLRQADQALYQAKSSGRNMVCVSGGRDEPKAAAQAS